MVTASIKYKDRLFGFLFGEESRKDWTLSLYNAVNNSNYVNANELQITTIREALYLGMHNDVSFLLSACEMNLYEQQSSFNPNMPLRLLQYLGSLYEKHVKTGRYDKYGHSLIPLPAPKLVVFYNGTQTMPESKTLLLSDSFPDGLMGDVEVTVRMLNINMGMNKTLLHACKPLAEYTWIVDKVRNNRVTMNLEHAVDDAIMSMPKDFVVRPLLIAHKAEVKDMLLTEYNEAETLELARENARKEGHAEGRAEGRAEGIVQTCESLGMTFAQATSIVASRLGVDEAKANETVLKYWE